MTRPKPITDPHTGHYRVVIAFRIRPHRNVGLQEVRQGLLNVLLNDYDETDGYIADLDVAVSVIGAGGERSEFEGTVGALANLDDIEHVHPVIDTQVEGGRL